jgi:hypothetical protein
VASECGLMSARKGNQVDVIELTFWRNMLPPSSQLKNYIQGTTQHYIPEDRNII